MLEYFRNECKFNYLTHLIFPARTLIKELIYWPTEIAAAIILLIYIIMMKTNTSMIYKDAEKSLEVNFIDLTNVANLIDPTKQTNQYNTYGTAPFYFGFFLKQRSLDPASTTFGSVMSTAVY